MHPDREKPLKLLPITTLIMCVLLFQLSPGHVRGDDRDKSQEPEKEVVADCFRKVIRLCDPSTENTVDECIARVLPDLQDPCRNIVDRSLRMRHFNDDKFLKENLGGPRVSLPVEPN
jgi:hypothetical protein